MSNQIRSRKPKVTPKSEDAFIEAYETPDTSELSIEERMQRRVKGRYFQGLSFRTTEEQKELLMFAAKERGMSAQKLVESIVMRELEQAHGQRFDESRRR